MALDSNTAFVNTDGTAFPNNEAINASGPTATDGTEYVKNLVDNYMFGPQQALLNHASLIPDGIPEADGTSQEVEAMQKSFAYPGEAVNWYGNVDPATLGLRILLLEGQGVLIANYATLTDAVYVGDGNNATAPAFYKADDAAGTIRNIAGVYLILPDATDIYPNFIGESAFGARIANGGVASIASQDATFIQSVTRTSTGNVDVVYVPGIFTVAPSVVATVSHPTGSGVFLSTYGETASGFSALTTSGVVQDRNFNIVVKKQGVDYTIFPDDFIRGAIRY